MKKLLFIIMLCFPLIGNAQDSTATSSSNKLDEVLAVAVQKGIVLAEKTGEFVIEQAPDLLRQFYAWHITTSILGMVFGVMIFLIGRYGPYLWLAREKSDDDRYRYFGRWGNYYSDSHVPAYILFALGLIFSMIVFCINTYDLIYILVAPKLYLIDYFIK